MPYFSGGLFKLLLFEDKLDSSKLSVTVTWSRLFFTLLELSDQVQFCLPASFLFLNLLMCYVVDVLCRKAQIINEVLGEFSQKDIPV